MILILRNRMAANKSNKSHPLQNLPNGPVQSYIQRGNVIEILDDSTSEDDTPPTSLRRQPRKAMTAIMGPSASSKIPYHASIHSVSSSATPDDSVSASDPGEIEAMSPVHKRVKVDHRRQIKVSDDDEGSSSPEVVFFGARDLATQPVGDGAGTNKREALPSLASGTPAPKLKLPVIHAKMPYYQDPTLELCMFCGPGYEKFPVVLGTVAGHQQICDRWDAMQKVEAQKASPGLPASFEQVSDSSSTPSDQEVDEVLPHILNVLPQIDHTFARSKIREHLETVGASFALQLDKNSTADHILSHILEAESYPQRSDMGLGAEPTDPAPDGTGVTVAWDRNLVKDAPYLKDAVILVASQFPYVPTHYIHRIVHQKQSIFDTYTHVNELESRYYSLAERPYQRSRAPRATLEKKYATRAHWERRNPDTFALMVNELQAAKQHVAREALKLERQKEKEEVESANLAAHKASGDLVECKCCFDDEIPINRTAPCQGEEIHFFCFGCVNQLADTQIGLMKYEMLCMDSSGCKASLSIQHVSQAIPTKTFDSLAFNQQQAEIAAAGIEGLEQCPFCDFKGICGPVEEDPNFHCQNANCFRATCRVCKIDAHSPKTCEEAKADKGLSARHLVEEARTEALVRTCPRCRVKIIKELGCNKMRCSKCNCLMCYVCKADISHGQGGGYEHFNLPESKCSLHDEMGAPVHNKDADAAEEEAIRKVKATNASIDENTLRIETGKKDSSSRHKNKDPIPQPRLILPPVYAVMNAGHHEILRANRIEADRQFGPGGYYQQQNQRGIFGEPPGLPALLDPDPNPGLPRGGGDNAS
ncbi:hypothetical protein DV736_g1012, partial [Chaetothyriales sp. CBS 134916]